MKTIYKYPLRITEKQWIRPPMGARLISAQLQNGVLCAWAIVDSEEKYMGHIQIFIVGTGNPMPEEAEDGRANYFASVQMGNFVWHIFAL